MIQTEAVDIPCFLMASNCQRKEAEDTPQQQLPTPTVPMT